MARVLHAERQTRKIDGTDNTKCVAERNRAGPLDFEFTGFGARDVNGDARPHATAIADGKLDVHSTVVEQERLCLSSEHESLICLRRERPLKRARKAGLSVP